MRSLRQTTLVGLCCAALLAGLALGVAHGPPLELLSSCLLAAGIAACRYHLARAVLLCLLGLGLGWCRGSAYMMALQPYRAASLQVVTLRGIATTDGSNGRKYQMSTMLGHVTINDVPVPGVVSLSGFGVNSIAVGDGLVAQGKLYPARGGYQARMSFAKLELAGQHRTPIDTLRSRFDAGVYSALPEPAASFALGLLIGQRSNLPDNVKQDLLWIGLTHIIAVSGYNLTILLRAAGRLLDRQPRRLALMSGCGLLLFFVLLTGESASILRAGLVSGLELIAAYYGRSVKSLNSILIAAAVTALLKPTYIWGDISWYLSFLAFFGVIVVAPLIMSRLPRLKRSIVVTLIVETLCAEAMTMPIILLTFGQLSTVGLLANMTIALLVPAAMLFSAIAGVAGMFMPLVAGWLAWPAALLLNAMLQGSRLLAGIPHAFVQNVGLSFWEMITIYMLIVAGCVMLHFKTRLKTATITDRI